jgi:hypothetical protein
MATSATTPITTISPHPMSNMRKSAYANSRRAFNRKNSNCKNRRIQQQP